MSNHLIEINDLKTYFFTSLGVVKAVDGIDLEIDRGETVGLVGESACGKTVTALSIIRLVPNPPGRIVSGEILFEGYDLLKKSEVEMRNIRGSKIAMIFQDPLSSLNPVIRVGDQITESILLHQDVNKSEAMMMAIESMELVDIPLASKRVMDYPHQFSGGMRQRTMIAMALACQPDLLIADEPTTALDVIVQDEILELMKNLRDKLNTSILLITHDLGIIARTCDKVAIMYAGKIAEFADTVSIFKSPIHPYTRGLLESLPTLDGRRGKLKAIKGVVPNMINPPTGCRFHPRCPYAEDGCIRQEPRYKEVERGRFVSCLLYE